MISRPFLLTSCLLSAGVATHTPPPRLLVQIEAPDARFVNAWNRAQRELDEVLEGDVAINALARAATGQLGHIRTSITTTPFTPASLVALQAYWATSGDHAFVRAKWGKAVAAFTAAARDTADEAGWWLTTVDAMLNMARGVNDPETRKFAEQLYPAAEARTARQLNLFALALGQYDAARADALLPRALRFAEIFWPLGNGLAALAFYEYHQDSTAFALLQRIAQESSVAAPMMVLPLMRGLVGWETDAINNAAALEPHLPAAWASLKVVNLPIGTSYVDATVRRETGSYSIHLLRDGSGAPLAVRIAPALPAGSRVRAVTVNERDVPVQVDATEHDLHVVVETFLVREVHIDIEYAAPRRRASIR